MKVLRLTIAALCLSGIVTIQGAWALTVDDSSSVASGRAANLGDPDDKIPYPHVSDDGTPSNSFQQGQQVGNSGVYLNVSPAGNPSDNAFQRAQERMQQ